jgi:hypothetical protein
MNGSPRDFATESAIPAGSSPKRRCDRNCGGHPSVSDIRHKLGTSRLWCKRRLTRTIFKQQNRLGRDFLLD